MGTWKPGWVKWSPPLNPMFDVQIWQMIHLSWALLLESANFFLLQICKNWIFYRKIQLYNKTVCKKHLSKNEKLYIFEKPLTMPFKIYKNFCKILINLIFNQEKQKMCKFPLTGCFKKICNFFFTKLVQSVSLCHRLSKNQKAKFYQNLTSESGVKTKN